LIGPRNRRAMLCISPRCRPRLGHHAGSAHNIDHLFHVAGHGGQTDLGLSSGEPAQQQARVSEDAVIERGEGMLRGEPPEPLRFQRGSLLHTSDDFFTQMSCNPAPRCRGTATLQRTVATSHSWSRVEHAVALCARAVSAPTCGPLDRAPH
jgi:hypothetical protein